ncbi:zf-HC2 domain-containing protein [Micromonospora peucetia]|uniref:Zf-HC2 domain-containing protein n=1 Tax=Micromonospora peucetia TaxID=47871 RepID=A0A1C6VW10_9ACTN|nr:hypothetical protein [Micromonospora peucetia]MCX4387977.1 zf-HC2 domain-containing protein [Micromonospora peucetia]WSA31332.1 zf-HC2 domain-containing protein [Micromonospora peucetia]SCL70475.1 hypothetical protein GA0070608_4348 [Micromonospora peucetia]
MTTHPSAALLSRYVDPDAAFDDPALWAVESHLDTCPTCRARLGDLLTAPARELVSVVHTAVTGEIARHGPPARHRPWLATTRRWLMWAWLPWLGMASAALVTAFLMQYQFPQAPSLVLLVAPVAPLVTMAGTWHRRNDPAWEIVATTPKAGLPLLLRRVFVVLLCLVPVLVVVGGLAGQSPARWLLPCLGFTALTLLLGARIGVTRAALVLGTGWLLAVLLPALVTARLPVLLTPAGTPGWLAVTGVCVVALVVVRDRYRRLDGWQ